MGSFVIAWFFEVFPTCIPLVGSAMRSFPAPRLGPRELGGANYLALLSTAAMPACMQVGMAKCVLRMRWSLRAAFNPAANVIPVTLTRSYVLSGLGHPAPAVSTTAHDACHCHW